MRYARQSKLLGQKKLADSRVAVIGLGGLGCTVAQMLCRAGVGHLHLYDHDKVSLSNLHRQILYHEGDIGKKKAMLAAQKLKKINSTVHVEHHDLKIDERTIRHIPEADLIADCTDNVKARIAINRHCISKRIPWVHAAVDGQSGIVLLFSPGKTCYECLMKGKKDPGNKQVLGTYPVIIGGLQATMALSALSGRDPDAFHLDFRTMELKKIKNGKCASKTHL